MFGLFAFQSARASVVIAKQPTSALFRTTQGATASAAPATRIPPTATARLPGRTFHAT